VTSESDPVIGAGCPVAGGYEAPPEPLGPGSLTWKYFGDWRGMLGPWAGSMQNMHPQLGAAVEEHSTQTSVRPRDSGPTLGVTAKSVGAVLRLAHRRSLRSACARADGVFLVGP
jgi:uncharacterized protein (DUF2236 family)